MNRLSNITLDPTDRASPFGLGPRPRVNASVDMTSAVKVT